MVEQVTRWTGGDLDYVGVKPSPTSDGIDLSGVTLASESESPVQQQPSPDVLESSRLAPSDLKVGDKVSFVRWVASQGSRESEVVVRLITKAYVYCDDMQTGDVHVFNRWNHHVAGLGWLKPADEQLQAEPLLLRGHSYPPYLLEDVLREEERQGRAVTVVIQHDGGWVVSSGNQHEYGGQEDLEDDDA